MKAMVLDRLVSLHDEREPLRLADMPVPAPGRGELLLQVATCGVCHTEIDVIEGRTPPAFLPIIPGHQVIGKVEDLGPDVSEFKRGDRVGVAWIFSSCGECGLCRTGRENLCSEFKATGRDAHGGYAEWMTAPERSVYRIPDVFSDAEAAPLLCAGAIGYRSLRLTGVEDGRCIGLVGFGASAHLVLKMIRHRFPGSRVFVFSRTEQEREFARDLGAAWAGDFSDQAPELLHAAIDTTPAWRPVVEALKNLAPGGRLVINAIRKEGTDKETLQDLDYARHLWLEKEIKSVANITRIDVKEFLTLAAEIPIRPEVEIFSLDEANKALLELKQRKIRGAKVLKIT